MRLGTVGHNQGHGHAPWPCSGEPRDIPTPEDEVNIISLGKQTSHQWLKEYSDACPAVPRVRLVDIHIPGGGGDDESTIHGIDLST